MGLVVEPSRFFAADCVEHVAFRILAILSDLERLAFSSDQLESACELIRQGLPHSISGLFYLWLFLWLSVWNGFFLFEDSILSGVEILYEIFIHKLIITVLLIHLFFEVVILFYRDF
jgi:hypothetical protein